MWPLIRRAVQTYAPYLPVAWTVGFIGYKLEEWIGDKHTPYRESAIERRKQRRIQELGDLQKEESLEDIVPRTIFEKNVSPSLRREF